MCAAMAEVNEELLQLVQWLLPSEEERAQQAAAFDAISRLLQVCVVEMLLLSRALEIFTFFILE